MVLAKGIYFNRDINVWVKVFVAVLISSFVLYIAKVSSSSSLQIIMTMWYNLAFTAIVISVFVLLYQTELFKKMTYGLRFYGRMSLTNYISQSVIGSIIFFPYAFGLADVLGVAWSLVVGVFVMMAQVWFSKIWLSNHKMGPLEYVWHKLTWIR